MANSFITKYPIDKQHLAWLLNKTKMNASNLSLILSKGHDKSVCYKWLSSDGPMRVREETAKRLTEIFGVDYDYLFHPEESDEEETKTIKKDKKDSLVTASENGNIERLLLMIVNKLDEMHDYNPILISIHNGIRDLNQKWEK